MWTKNKIPDLTGKTAIVTGSNTGIGYQTAKVLYEKGASVTLAARNPEKVLDAIEKIKSEYGGMGHLEAAILDLSNLKQINSFADQFNRNHQRLDISWSITQV